MVKSFAKGINLVLGNLLRKKHVFIGNSLDFLTRERRIDKNYFDYIRIATLELVSSEIRKKGIQGNVAELGVYKGKFARYINEYFPDRTLYLFDTFKGFDERDIEEEKQQRYSTGNQNFSDTSIQKVMDIMPHPANCKPIKGFFPEAAEGIEDKFVFVSLDTDLYAPIYNGLEFFYPRLSKGGYIFIHDFNNDAYKGARQAVEDFALKWNINYTPIPDSCGTAVIAK